MTEQETMKKESVELMIKAIQAAPMIFVHGKHPDFDFAKEIVDGAAKILEYIKSHS